MALSRRVVVLGAAGYIGEAVACSLRSQGHHVTGVVRKESQAAQLRAQEVGVLVADVMDQGLETSLSFQPDVIIDCIGAQDFEAHWDKVGSYATTKAAQYIYTAGCLDYGDHPGVEIDEDTQCPSGGRSAYCAKLLGCQQTCKVAVIRPGFVYGKSFGRFASSWFAAGDDGKVVIEGNPERAYGYVHVDDVARAYVAVVETDAQGVYDLADSTRMTYKQVRLLFAKHAGLSVAQDNVVYQKENPWPAGDISCQSKGTKITSLGFQYRHGPLEKEMETGFQAFSAIKN